MHVEDVPKTMPGSQKPATPPEKKIYVTTLVLAM
jgi:hypothetical protein